MEGLRRGLEGSCPRTSRRAVDGNGCMPICTVNYFFVPGPLAFLREVSDDSVFNDVSKLEEPYPLGSTGGQ